MGNHAEFPISITPDSKKSSYRESKWIFYDFYNNGLLINVFIAYYHLRKGKIIIWVHQHLI